MTEVARPRGSGPQSVYNVLRNDILAMKLAPGSPLDEVRLSERFGMSRTPIREALLRLSADGLVTTLPNRNTIVSQIDFSGLPHYFEALTLMYRVTTRGAAQRSSGANLDAILQHQKSFADAVTRQDAFAMIEANREFHVAIAELAGNPFYTTFFAKLLDEGRRILRLYYSSFDDRLPRQYVDEHEKMIDVIKAGDVEQADQLAIAHAAQIVRQIQDYLSSNVANAVSITGL
jgi:DNA-binding GntR family transcriptional regulator